MARPISFLEGWRSLPDELKLHVLSFVLPSAVTLHHGLFSKAWIEQEVKSLREYAKSSMAIGNPLYKADLAKADSYTHLHDSIIPLLAITEIAQLATEVVYKQNVVSMDISPCPMYLPPPPTHKFVRTIKLDLALCSEAFQGLQRLFHGTFDFRNLKLVELDIYDLDDHSLATFRIVQAIRVRTKTLRVLYKHLYRPPSVLNQECALAVLALFTVVSQKEVDVKEQTYIIKYDDYEGKHKILVKTWPTHMSTLYSGVTERIVKV